MRSKLPIETRPDGWLSCCRSRALCRWRGLVVFAAVLVAAGCDQAPVDTGESLAGGEENIVEIESASTPQPDEANNTATSDCLASADWLNNNSLPADFSDEKSLCAPQQFAWQSFLYLVNKSISDAPRFTSWMPSYGIFVGAGEDPVPYGKHPPDKCTELADAENLPATGTQPVFYSNLIKQAGSDHPLIDATGNYVWYSIAVNLPTYDMLTSCELYKSQCASNLKHGSTGRVDMNKYPHLAFPDGAVELKTSWKVLDESEKEAGHFYTAQGYIQTPKAGGECKLADLGLTGMHIVSKTPKNPSFTWATFEHRANAPDCTDLTASPPVGKEWSFFDADACDNCEANKYVPGKPTQVCRMHPQGDSTIGIWPDGKDCQVDSSAHICSADTRAMLAENTSAIKQINQSARTIIEQNSGSIDSVWLNYELTGNVWMKDSLASQQANYMAGSLSSANTSMETFVQNGQAGQTAANNCFSCHTQDLGNGRYLPPAGLSHIFDKVVADTGGCEADELPLACGIYHQP